MKRVSLPWLTFLTVSIGTFMSTSSAGIVNTALPTLSRVLDEDLSTSKWIVSSFLLTVSALLPVAGKFSDIYGSIRLYNLGFFIFVLGSACIGASNSLEAIVGFRILQAVGSTALVTNNVAILSSAFPPSQRGRAIGLLVAVVGVGSLSGPALSGLILQFASWRWLFWLDIPVGLLGGTLALLVLPRKPYTPAKSRVNGLEAMGFAATAICMILVLSQAPDWGWLDWRTVGLAIAAFLSGSWFIQKQQRTKEPLLDTSLFQNPTLSISAFTSYLSFAIAYFTLVLMPFYLDQVFQMQPGQIGLLMTYYPLALALFSPLGGWLSDRYGSRLLLAMGALLIGIGQLGIVLQSNLSPLWQVIGILVIQGFGMGLFSAPNNTCIITAVPREKIGTGGSILAFVRVFGQVTGTTLGVALFQLGAGSTTASSTTAFLVGFRLVFSVGFVFALVMLYLSMQLHQTPTEVDHSKNFDEP